MAGRITTSHARNTESSRRKAAPMRQLNATETTNKTRVAVVRPPSPASVSSGFSLYSTDTEDQVACTHRGLDRCAALLANMMHMEESEKAPTKLERGRGAAAVKHTGVTRPNQPGKQAGRNVKKKPKMAEGVPAQKRPQPRPSRQNKPSGRMSTAFNQRLVSSTPTQSSKAAVTDVKKKKTSRQGQGRVTSKENPSDIRKQPPEGKDRKSDDGVRIPIRITPGDKENLPSPHLQQRFVETYDVSPQVLNSGITKTLVNAAVVQNPVLRTSNIDGMHTESHGMTHFGTMDADRGATTHSTNPTLSEPCQPPRTVTDMPPQHYSNAERLYEAQCQYNQQPVRLASTRDQDPELQPHFPHRHHHGHLQEVAHQGGIPHPGGYAQNAQQPHHDTEAHGNTLRSTQDGILFDTEAGQMSQAQHQQHMGVPGHHHTLHGTTHVGDQERTHAALSHGGTRSSQVLSSGAYRGHDSCQRDVALSQTGPCASAAPTTQSVLRDLVTKLQEMNRSQAQTTDSHPSLSRNDATHSFLYTCSDPNMPETKQDGPVHVYDRGVSSKHPAVIRGDVNSQPVTIRVKQLSQGGLATLEKESDVRTKTHRPGSHPSRPGPAHAVHQNPDHTNAHEVPVKESSQPDAQQPLPHQPLASPVTQMQRISSSTPEGTNPRPADAKSEEHCGSVKEKDDIGVQEKSPPRTPGLPLVTRGDKGSSALWDQVRTLQYLTRELRTATANAVDLKSHNLLSEMEEVIETLPYTSLERDVQTEVSLALQPIRSENSQLRRKLRIANQQLRQLQLQADGAGSSQSGASLEVLTLRTLNVNLQKQVDELLQEMGEKQREEAEMKALVDRLTADKHNMQDIFQKMDTNSKQKRKDWTLETSNLRQEISQLKSQKESEHLKLESVEREKEILRDSLKQRDAEISRLQEMTRDMQQIIAATIPAGRSPGKSPVKSLKSSLPDESRAARLEHWLDQHSSPGVSQDDLDRSGAHFVNGWKTTWNGGQRSPHVLDSSQSVSSSDSTAERIERIEPTLRVPGASVYPRKPEVLDSTLRRKRKSAEIEEILNTGGSGIGEDLDSTLIGGTFDGDDTAYLSIAKPGEFARNPWSCATQNKHLPVSENRGMTNSSLLSRTSGADVREFAGRTPSWVEKELSPNVVNSRRSSIEELNWSNSGDLGRTLDRHTAGMQHNKLDQQIRQSDREKFKNDERHKQRQLRGIFSSTEVGSVVSESTISSIATQYEAQFQVGLSKLDADIARLQENLKGFVKR